MATLIIRRLGQAVPSLFIITFIGFALLSLAPGDPLTARLDREALVRMTPEQRTEAREALGLDEPFPVQYWHWLTDLVQGDVGYSIVSGRPALEEIGDRVEPTLILLVAAIAIAVAVGVPFGILAARRPNGFLDRTLTGAAVAMISTPTFIVGLVLIYVFAIRLDVLPAGGMGVAGEPPSTSQTFRHAILPSLVLGLANAAPLARFARSGMLEVLASDYVRTARAKGLSGRAIMMRHGLRNASLPLITLIALLIPDLVAGAVITEQVFAWPGMGRLVVSSAQSADPAVMMAIIVMVAVVVILVNLAADILYVFVDPRLRVS
ncbi:ABC transporter permease [Nocardioides bigeumensis]|uniref:ABC transporter permease n=1 Tax=Nocardioides bigeumensis TaxID=433657 RepID=A0ABN2XKW7_9ACTN